MRRAADLIALLTLLAVPVTGHAQGGSVAGRIADAAGSPVAEALVSLDPGGWKTRSSDQGEYSIARVPAGTYTMRVRIPGFVGPPTLVSIAEGQAARQDVSLARVAVSLSDVVIGSRARHTAADELAVPVDVFTAEDVKEQGTTETSQISQPARRCPNCHQAVAADKKFCRSCGLLLT